jgi:hypothetical protein
MPSTPCAPPRGGRDPADPVRHQWRLAARPGHRRDAGGARAPAAAHIGIHVHNDGGLAVANTLAAVAAGRDAGAGHHQRHRRALRQRRPHQRHRQCRDQARPALPARRPPAAPHRDQPPGVGAHQPACTGQPALRRPRRLRAQGRRARQRGAAQRPDLRARHRRSRSATPGASSSASSPGAPTSRPSSPTAIPASATRS